MPSFGRELEITLHRALEAAQTRDHEYAVLEHLLLALLDDPDAHTALVRCGANVEQLRARVAEYLDKELESLMIVELRQKKRKTKKDKDTIARYDESGPSPTSGFQRVVQRAILHVQASGREDVTGVNVLVALFSERESYAVFFLQEQNVSRLDVVTWVSHGVGKLPSDGEAESSTAPDVLTTPTTEPPRLALNRAFRDDLRAISDSVATEPVLNTPRVADKIVEFALDLVSQAALAGASQEAQHRPLLTFGLYGPWGSGKSTLLKSIAHRMEQEGLTTVFINTWKWDGTTDVYSFMSDQLLASLSKFPDTKWRAWIIRLLVMCRRNYLRVFALSLVAVFGTVVYLSIDWSQTITATEIAKGSILGVIVGSIAAILAKPISSLIERVVLQERRVSSRDTLSWSYKYLSLTKRMNYWSRHRPIAFLFDDLDRCADTRVVEFLQSVHSLTSDGSICVVACDEDFVAAALYSHFKGVAEFLNEGKNFGRRFLEKIIQVPFRMPEIARDDLFALGLGASQTKRAESLAAAVVSVVEPRPTPPDTDGPGVPKKDLGRDEDEISVSEVRLSEICGETLALVVEPCRLQIRQVKMLSNIIKLYSMIFPPADEIAAERLSTFIVVNYIDQGWIWSKYFSADNANPNPALDGLESEIRSRLGEDKEALDLLYRLCGIR